MDATPSFQMNARVFLFASIKYFGERSWYRVNCFFFSTSGTSVRFDRRRLPGLTRLPAPDQHMWKIDQSALVRFAAGVSLLLPFLPTLPAGARSKETLTTPGLVREFNAPIEEVRQAVMAVVRDQIIHGTLIFDKEPILTGAEAVDSTPLFDPWTGPGEVYFKIRQKAIAPRHFKDSGDQGTIAVRYVIIPVDAYRTRV